MYISDKQQLPVVALSIGDYHTRFNGRKLFSVPRTTLDATLLLQGSHYLLILKFKDFSRTFKFHFQGPILDGSLQHEQ